MATAANSVFVYHDSPPGFTLGASIASDNSGELWDFGATPPGLTPGTPINPIGVCLAMLAQPGVYRFAFPAGVPDDAYNVRFYNITTFPGLAGPPPLAATPLTWCYSTLVVIAGGVKVGGSGSLGLPSINGLPFAQALAEVHAYCAANTRRNGDGTFDFVSPADGTTAILHFTPNVDGSRAVVRN